MTMETYLTAEQVAVELAVSLATIRRLLLSGELPGYRLRGQWRISRSDLAIFLDERKNASRVP